MTAWQQIRWWAGRLCLGLLLLGLFAYAVDWIVWRVRGSHGTATSTVQVTRMVVAPLKGNREEYYMDGTEDLPCSQSLFPQGGDQACWWLARHHVVFER